MDRSGAECPIDADPAPGLFPLAREVPFKADARAGQRRDWKHAPGRARQVDASRSRSFERPFRNRQPRVARLATVDAAGLVRSLDPRSQHAAATRTGRAGASRGVAHAAHGTGRDRDADAGAHIGRRDTPLRRLSRLQEAQQASRVRLLGGRIVAGQAGALFRTGRIRVGRGAVH